MSVTYNDLSYRDIAGQKEKEVYNTKTGVGYSTPEALSADLGAPVDWSKIGTTPVVSNPTAVVASNSPASNPNYIPPTISPVVPTTIAPENAVSGVQSVLGSSYTPTSASLQKQGILGAVRVAGSPNVFSLGTGGGWETQESLAKKGLTNSVMEITQEQATKLGINPQSISAAPETNPNITIAGMQPVKSVVLPQNQNVDASAGVAAAATTQQEEIKKWVDILNGQKTSAETSLDKMIADYTATMGESEGRGAAQAQAEKDAGIQAKIEVLNGINAQISTKNAEYAQAQADYEAKRADLRSQKNGGLTSSYGLGTEQNLLDQLSARKNSLAADLGLLTAQAQAAQGNVTAAQNSADRAVELKYSDITQRLADQKSLIELYQAEATKEEKTRLDAINLTLADTNTALENQKDKEKSIQAVMLEAAKNGADSTTLAKISASTSVEQAMQNAGKSLTTVEQWSEPYQVGDKILQSNKKTGEIKQVAGISSGESSGLTPYQIVSLTNQIEDNLRVNPAVVSFGQLVNFGVPQVIEQFNAGVSDSVSDTILMRTLAKITDPSTGVREEEYKTFEDAMGSLNKLYVTPNSWIGRGRLTDTGRKEMIREIQNRYDARLNDYNNQYQYYKNQAANSGVAIPPPYLVSTNQINLTSADKKNYLDEIVNQPVNNQPVNNQTESQPQGSILSQLGETGNFFGGFLNLFGLGK